MKRTVSLLLLVSCFSVVVVSCGCGSPKSTEPAKTEQTQPAPEAQQPTAPAEEQAQPAAPAEEAQPAVETAPEATAAK